MSLPPEIKQLVAEYNYPSFRINRGNSNLVIGGLEKPNPAIPLTLKPGLWNVMRSPSAKRVIFSPFLDDDVWAPVFSIILYHYTFDIKTLPTERKVEKSTIDVERLVLTLCDNDKPVLHMEIGAHPAPDEIFGHSIFPLQGVTDSTKDALVALVIPIALTYSEAVENNYRKILGAVQQDLTRTLREETLLPLYPIDTLEETLLSLYPADTEEPDEGPTFIDLPTLIIDNPTADMLQRLGLDGKNDPMAAGLRDIRIDQKKVMGTMNDYEITSYEYDVSAPNTLLQRLWDFIGKISRGRLKLQNQSHTISSIMRIEGNLEVM